MIFRANSIGERRRIFSQDRIEGQLIPVKKVVMKLNRINGGIFKDQRTVTERFRILRTFIVACAGVLCLGSPAFGLFEEIGIGARDTALGGAFSAIGNDVHALNYNPAGLSYLKRNEFSATYGILYSGLTDNSTVGNSYVAYGQPIRKITGAFAVSWQQFSVENLLTERAVTLGYGRSISEKWAAGINVKQFHRSFDTPSGQTTSLGVVDLDKSDPVFSNGNSRSNYSTDVGLLFRPYRNLSIGLAFQNLNEPDLALADNDDDRVPLTARLGAAYKDKLLTIITELTGKQSIAERKDMAFTTAMEKWWIGFGFLRGEIAARGSVAIGSRDFRQATMGLTYRIHGIQVDYGFLMPLAGVGLNETQGNHRVTLTYRFGRTSVQNGHLSSLGSSNLTLRKSQQRLEWAKREFRKLSRDLRKVRTDSKKRRFEIEKARRDFGEEAGEKVSQAQFSRSMDRYWRRKSYGAPSTVRARILSQILEEFSGRNIDMNIAKKELSEANTELTKAQADLKDYWSLYQELADRGEPLQKRIDVLYDMVEKYLESGVDSSDVQKELRVLSSSDKFGD